MKLIEKTAARFANTRIYVHHRTDKYNQRPDGRYIHIGGIFKMGAPKLKRRQFIGIHKHLILTINYPDYTRDVLGIAADLPGIPSFGNVTWIGTVKCTLFRKGLYFYIPRRVWGIEDIDLEEPVRTTSTVTILYGEEGGCYHILNVPLFDRQYFCERYKERKEK
jgi:hypothetical protein